MQIQIAVLFLRFVTVKSQPGKEHHLLEWGMNKAFFNEHVSQEIREPFWLAIGRILGKIVRIVCYYSLP